MSARREARVDIALLVGLVIAVVWITHAYVSYERFFYFWDHAVYQKIALRTAAAFRLSLPAGWQALQDSFLEDYNALFALPLVPWLLLFGSSRMSYELGLALVYLVPLPLCWGAVATQLVPGSPRVAFWGTAWLALLMPMTWVPTLRGYPDAGAAVMMAVAVYLYLRDPELQDRMTILAVGTLLALSVIFRRHFAYAAVAFLVAALVHSLLVNLLGAPPLAERARRVVLQALRLGLVMFAAAMVALLVAHNYVERLRAFDFSTLYRSYEQSLGAVVSWYVAPYGWVTWWLAAAGWLMGLASRRVRRSELVFVLLFGLVFSLHWCWRVRQIGEQYTLHLTPLIVLGWLLLCVVTWDLLAPALARPALGIVFGLACINLFLGLTYPDRSRDLSIRPLFAARWAPLVRFDYDEMLRLVLFLRAHSKPEDNVYVAASSGCLNPDILRQADAVVANSPQNRLAVMSAPLVDSDGFYPLGELVEARYVVVARPFQHHLAAHEQDVVKGVYDLFDRHLAVAQDFEPLESYQLSGCTATVYRRQHPTTLPVALATLGRLESAVATRPGMQPDWVIVDSSTTYRSWLTRNADGSTRWVAHAGDRNEKPPTSTTAATLMPLSDETSVEATVAFTDARCSGATVSFAALRSGGAVESLAAVRRRPGEDAHVELRLPTRGAERLLLSVLDYGEGAVTDYCLVALESVRLRAVAP